MRRSSTLNPDGVRSLADRLETYDVLEQPGPVSLRHERFRRHGVAVRIGAERIAEIARLPRRDELAVAALLHDVGKLVIAELYGAERAIDDRGEPPEERARRERRELGIDHALVGAVLVRRWGMPPIIAGAVERHHSSDATGHAAAIRLADMVVHHAAGDAVSPEAMRAIATALEIDEEGLSALMFEFPHVGERRRRATEPCPLSMRELDAAPRARRGQGLQADRPGALALGEHGPHPPSQRVPEDRRGRSRAGGPARPRPRLALKNTPARPLLSLESMVCGYAPDIFVRSASGRAG